MATEIKPCRCGTPAVEQTRKEMGPGDYKEMVRINNKGREVDDAEFYKRVELTEYNGGDFRISCTLCDNATPWNRVPDGLPEDMRPAMAEAARDHTRKLWNQDYAPNCQHEPAMAAAQKPASTG